MSRPKESLGLDPARVPDNPYLLLTPGPLSTTKRVRAVLTRDWCTWDDEYKQIVQRIREQVVELATAQPGFTCVPMQGSGTFAVEAMLGSEVARDGRLLVVANGAYGRRMAEIAERLAIEVALLDLPETEAPELDVIRDALRADPRLSHVALVHCETTTGILNPAGEVGALVRAEGRTFLLDAMSSFAGVEMDQHQVGAHYLVSSANKCIQGIPGFGFVVAEAGRLAASEGRARSLSLDLHDQWHAMEDDPGKWRFTSPTHAVRAFAEALCELHDEGGVAARAARYRANQRATVEGMRAQGFETLLPDALQSPIITAFHHPASGAFEFARFYAELKRRGFVIYPGKVSDAPTFRIGHIGDVHPEDVAALLAGVRESTYWA